MEELEGISGLGVPGGGQSTGNIGDTASDAFGLQFESLLQIILTQLTFQDPLQPIENFEFVSQLAQFSQIQQAETANERLLSILDGNATTQAVALLGAEVEIPAGTTTISGTVTAISLANGAPRLTVETSDDQTIENINISNVIRIERGGQ
ncbi:MAG: flagellar hook capping FlgD N-terminal domain-containing protein [Pseudomonadota bacterium]